MGMLNLNSADSVRENLTSTREEIAGFIADIWPPVSLVPTRSRASYRRTMEAQERYLIARLAVLETGEVSS